MAEDTRLEDKTVKLTHSLCGFGSVILLLLNTYFVQFISRRFE